MKTEEILNLDYRSEENQKIIQKVLRKIKPLSKFPEDEFIPIEKLEKTVSVLTNRYEIIPQWMVFGFKDLAPGCISYYSVAVENTKEQKMLGSVGGSTIYELFAKLVIKMYAEVRSENVPERKATKQEEQRERIARKIDKQEVRG